MLSPNTKSNNILKLTHSVMKIFNIFKKAKHSKTRLLFIAHDFKFLPHVLNHFSNHTDYETGKFSYKGHVITEPEMLKRMLPEVDLLFCEWGLGNLSWLSNHKLRRQKLITRIHRQEFTTRFLKETNWNAVDAIIFINELQLNDFIKMFPATKKRCHLIYNLISCESFGSEKLNGSMYNLGLLGMLPKSKAPHHALEILKQIKKKNSNFKLLVKSKRPEELDWLWRREDERDYYNRFYDTIKSDGLENSVIFEPHGQDVPGWFKNVGFILSTSDFEGSHQSVAEGMAAGSIPIIRNWQGANMLYPEKYIFNSTENAAYLIRSWIDNEAYRQESESVKLFAKKHFDLNVILDQYEGLFNHLKSKS